MEKRSFPILGLLLVLVVVSESGVIVPREVPSGDGEIPLAMKNFAKDKNLGPHPRIWIPEEGVGDFGNYEFDMGVNDPHEPQDYDYMKPGRGVNEVDKNKPGIIKPEKIPPNEVHDDIDDEKVDKHDDFDKKPGDIGFHEPFDGKEDFDKSVGGGVPVWDKDKPNHKDVDEKKISKDDDDKKVIENNEDDEDDDDDTKVSKENDDDKKKIDDDDEKKIDDDDDDEKKIDDNDDDKKKIDDDDNEKKIDEDEKKIDDDDDDDEKKIDDDDDDDEKKIDDDDDDVDDDEKKIDDDDDDDKKKIDDDERGDDDDDKKVPEEDDKKEDVPIDGEEKPDKGDETFDEGKKPGFFSGGSIFDTPIFNLEKVQKYFGQLEKALGHVFQQTLDEALLLNGTYANTTEEEVDIDGKKYIVRKSVIQGADNDSSIYVEALSSKAETKNPKDLEDLDAKNATHQ